MTEGKRLTIRVGMATSMAMTRSYSAQSTASALSAALPAGQTSHPCTYWLQCRLPSWHSRAGSSTDDARAGVERLPQSDRTGSPVRRRHDGREVGAGAGEQVVGGVLLDDADARHGLAADVRCGRSRVGQRRRPVTTQARRRCSADRRRSSRDRVGAGPVHAPSARPRLRRKGCRADSGSSRPTHRDPRLDTAAPPGRRRSDSAPPLRMRPPSGPRRVAPRRGRSDCCRCVTGRRRARRRGVPPLAALRRAARASRWTA